MARTRRQRPVIGWREYLALPDLSDVRINAKVDTGARTSALHAFGLEIVERDGIREAQFELHPVQRSSSYATPVRLPVVRYRKVRSSNGKTENRPTVVTTARLGEVTWQIELTLTSRDAMGYRMLLGRSAVRNRFIINPSRSYLLGRKPDRKDL
jgi:hypothetical protein